MKAKILFSTFLAVALSACGGGGHHHSGSSSGDDGSSDNGSQDQYHDGITLNPSTGETGYGISLGGGIYLDPTTGQTYFGIGLSTEKNIETSKDLEKVGAVMSKAQTRAIGEQIAANYGLSESRGIEVAALMMAYHDLKQSRALTPADQDRFAMAITGSTQQDLQHANDDYNAGKVDNIDALVQRAADKNGTTPENVRAILSQLLQ